MCRKERRLSFANVELHLEYFLSQMIAYKANWHYRGNVSAWGPIQYADNSAMAVLSLDVGYVYALMWHLAYTRIADTS